MYVNDKTVSLGWSMILQYAYDTTLWFSGKPKNGLKYEYLLF